MPERYADNSIPEETLSALVPLDAITHRRVLNSVEEVFLKIENTVLSLANVSSDPLLIPNIHRHVNKVRIQALTTRKEGAEDQLLTLLELSNRIPDPSRHEPCSLSADPRETTITFV